MWGRRDPEEEGERLRYSSQLTQGWNDKRGLTIYTLGRRNDYFELRGGANDNEDYNSRISARSLAAPVLRLMRGVH